MLASTTSKLALRKVTAKRTTKRQYALKKADLPKNVLEAQYAVRGAIVLKAQQIQKQLLTPNHGLPFDKVIFCNIGNPQELGQKPITFYRQVTSLVENPNLLSNPVIRGQLPSDAIARAEEILASVPGGTGAYSQSQGIEITRKHVADFITRRDEKTNVPGYASPDDIFLSDGASQAVHQTLKMLISKPTDGIMIPIPQYPLYSATISLLGGTPIPYYLDEENNWGLGVKQLEKALADMPSGTTPKAIVIINPGNPTGQNLPKADIQAITDFARQKGLVVLADEVYQENVYIKDKKPFYSFKRAKHEMGSSFKDLELFSFHSVSKGVIGECGKRGGYAELDGIDSGVRDEYLKLASINLCPNIIGQVMVSLMVNPPKPGDASYALYKQETEAIYASLKRRALMVTNTMNTLEGVVCNPAEGAMYAFPQISLPAKAIVEAKNQGIAPDAYYSLKLLQETGIVVVPGSGFGQRPDTFHFRTTFLPLEEHISEVLVKYEKFHHKFLADHK